MFRSVKKSLSAAISFAILFSLLAACSSPSSKADGNASVANSGDATTSQNNADIPMEDRPVVTMFMGDSGLAIPTGANIDPSDNEFIRAVEDYAGVNIELVVPAYQDFSTQFNLMMTSGDMPDVVHTWLVDDAYKYGDQGAFIDLKKYYDESKIIQDLVPADVMEMVKSESGKYFRIPQTNNAATPGYGNWIRYDLLQEYNGGKYPTDIDGYVEFLRWVKKTYPDSIPLTARSTDTKIFLYGEVFFKWFGAMPQSYNVVDGKVVSTFTMPAYRAAVELYRQLYAEGILDKEFATTDPESYQTKMLTKNMAMGTDLPANLLKGNMTTIMNDETKDMMRLFTPELTSYPENANDEIYTKAFKSSPASIHGLYISSDCKNPDLAWKVIEGFASQELLEKVVWGTEGVEYTVDASGNRVVNADVLFHENRKWSTQLLILHGFASNSVVNEAISKERLGEEKFNKQAESMGWVVAETEERGMALIDVYRYTSALMVAPPSIKEKQTEIDGYTAEATIAAITGQIGMEEFDKRVEEYKTRYAFVDQDWTAQLSTNKDFLVSVGALEASR